jgi:hypothetical protein
LRHDVLATVADARRELSEGLAAVRALVQAERAQTATRNKSSAPEKEFEDAVAEICGNWAACSGDSVEPVGTQPAPGTSRKVGDIVIRLMTPGTSQPAIAVEAKRRAKALTSRQHREELCGHPADDHPHRPQQPGRSTRNPHPPARRRSPRPALRQ